MKPYIPYLCLATALTGCGSSSEDSSVLTGKLSNIGGLGYTTKTQSGVTSLTGEYQYNKGETITFSLGGSEIATVAAKPNYDLFDLLDTDSTLPKTALDLRTQLRAFDGFRTELLPTRLDANERIGGQASGIHLASNKVRVLLAVDEDHDLSNGINAIAGDWHNRLAEQTLDFNKPLDEFKSHRTNLALKQIQHEFELPMPYDFSYPVVALYASKNIAISGKTITASNENNYDQYQYQKNDDGRVESSTILYNNGYKKLVESEYDEFGSLISQIEHSDTNYDGNYDKKNTIDYTNNAYGQPIKSIRSRYENGDEENPVHNTESLYSYMNGRVYQNSYTRFIDSDNDGNVNSVYGTRTNYDDAFNLVSDITPIFALDGTILYPVSNQKLQGFDSENRLISSTYQSNFDELGNNPAYTKPVTISYDDLSRTIIDGNQSGFHSIITMTLSDTGKLVSSSLEDMSDATSSLYLYNTTYAYDDQGRFDYCSSQVIDSGKNGRWEGEIRSEFEWNDYGINKIIYKSLPKSENNEGYTETTADIQYGEEGEWISINIYRDSYNYSYETVDNALGHIITDFYEIERNQLSISSQLCQTNSAR